MFEPDRAVSWVDYADRSYTITRMLYFTAFWFDAAVSAHRTIELYLKAYLVSRGETVKRGSRAWGHNLAKLCAICACHSDAFSNCDLVRRVTFFQKYFEHVRYPNREANPKDGSLTWFSFEANISPLDELVAFIRPRILLSEEEWLISFINEAISNSEGIANGYHVRALRDHNVLITTINCSTTNSSIVRFDRSFTFDMPGC